MVIVLPAMVAAMFLGMQGALYYHARNVAMAAASEGARVAAVENGRTSDGIGAASRFIADAGGDRVLAALAVYGDRSPGQVVITVSGTSLSVVPGWQPRVTATGSATTERLTGEP